MRRTMMGVLLSSALAGGCYGGDVAYRGTVTATATMPDLVYVAPGVQVIADYSEPIFYADGFYWWIVDGAWYRSTYYTGGWTFVAAPPLVISQLQRPNVYRHYRPAGYVAQRRPVPADRVQRPVVRDHRRRR